MHVSCTTHAQKFHRWRRNTCHNFLQVLKVLKLHIKMHVPISKYIQNIPLVLRISVRESATLVTLFYKC